MLVAEMIADSVIQSQDWKSNIWDMLKQSDRV